MKSSRILQVKLPKTRRSKSNVLICFDVDWRHVEGFDLEIDTVGDGCRKKNPAAKGEVQPSETEEASRQNWWWNMMTCHKSMRNWISARPLGTVRYWCEDWQTKICVTFPTRSCHVRRGSLTRLETDTKHVSIGISFESPTNIQHHDASCNICCLCVTRQAKFHAAILDQMLWKRFWIPFPSFSHLASSVHCYLIRGFGLWSALLAAMGCSTSKAAESPPSKQKASASAHGFNIINGPDGFHPDALQDPESSWNLKPVPEGYPRDKLLPPDRELHEKHLRKLNRFLKKAQDPSFLSEAFTAVSDGFSK